MNEPLKGTVGPAYFRAEMKRLMQASVDDQRQHGNWRYRAVRPQTIPSSYHGQTVEADCSDGCRTIARCAGVTDDPAGNGYAPFGNSSSIWAHLHTSLPVSKAEVGDIFTLGRSTGEQHACMVFDTTNPRDPTVWNLGTQGQPVLRKLSQEIAGHPGATATLCKIKLPPAPVVPPSVTAIEKLREETGFYAWFAWRQAEGDWKPYGAMNKRVRPNVPPVVSPKWWAWRIRFLANRKKPNAATSKP